MNYIIIARPLIGAVIGYVTNWIAVKMLFRPLKPIKLWNVTLPFTPGIIPKNKKRIAESIGKAISENLLTKETLINNLLSDEKEKKLKIKVKELLEKNKENYSTIEESICKYVDRKSYVQFVSCIANSLQVNIFKIIKEAEIGKIVAEQIKDIAKEKLKGSVLGILGGNSIINNISNEATKKIDEYIDLKGNEIISKMISNEIDKIANMKISETITKIEETGIDLSEIVINIYRKLILKELPEILKVINISNIVTDKIYSMDMKELEILILDIMKKELNALVNLGAIIGFVLGCLNLLF